MSIFAAVLFDQFAVLTGSPPAYTISAPRPPTLGLRKEGDNLPSSSTTTKSRSLTLVQHEVCWTIQCYLRMTASGYVVVNTPYHRLYNGAAAYPVLVCSSYETNDDDGGPTYYIPSQLQGGGGGGSGCRDTTTSTDDSDDASSSTESTPFNEEGDPILNHLKKNHKDLETTSSYLSTTIIRTVLSPILLSLTFADPIGYHAHYSQFITAYKEQGHGFIPSLLAHVCGGIKLFGERISVLRALRNNAPIYRKGGKGQPSASGVTARVDVELALTTARKAYEALDEEVGKQLASSNPSTLFEAVLFGHIVEGLSNPQMVKILPHYTNLMTFFCRMIEKHFQGAINGEGGNEWQRAADDVNAGNSYNKLIECYKLASSSLKGGNSKLTFLTIDDAMIEERRQKAKLLRAGSNLHRLRFGGSMVEDQGYSNTDQPPAKKPTPDTEVARIRERENAIWVAGVTVVITGFVFGSGFIRVVPK
jgi:hypothetical protein